MSLNRFESSLSESSNISAMLESLNFPTALLIKSESCFSSTLLCNNFIDLTAASSESLSDLEIPEIYIDSLIQTTDDELDTITKTYNFFTKKLCINKIPYSPILIEYLPTSLEGRVQVCHYEKKSDDDIQSYFIECSAWSPEQKHFNYKLNCNEIDITILEKLFRKKS
ncbi:16558_t:CDS:2, partial [Cetraspora pellucida]